ncbi:hypothetical protein ACFLTO_02800 [Chloroflexota bacterium]
MSKRLQLLQSRDRVSVITAIAGALLGAVILLLGFVYSKSSMISIGLILIIVCLVYLIFKQKLLALVSDHQASRGLILIINITFWLSLAGSIYSLSAETLNRPLIYFILISIAASMIALQILYSRQKGTTYLILFEVLLVSLSVRASAFFVFPTIPGADPWEHANYIKDFVNLGRIASTSGNVHYLDYPIMHLNVTAMKLITGTGVDYKATMFLGVGLPLMLSSVFVFLIGRSLVNTRVALLAALLISLADCHLMWSIQIIAMSLGISLYTMILYLFLRDKDNINSLSISLVIVALFVLILTHTVSAFIMFCFILSFLIGKYAYRLLYIERGTSERNMISFGLLALFGVGMLAVWMNSAYVGSGTFFHVIVRAFYGSLTTEAAFMDATPVASGLRLDLNNLGFLILVFFGILGCLLWLTQKEESRTKVSLIAMLIVFFATIFSFSLFGIKNILPGRWYVFIYIVLTIVAASAILTVIYRIGYHKLRAILLICIVFGISFFMITNNNSNMDSPIYTLESNSRKVYTNSEMAVGEWVAEAYDGEIITDVHYGGQVLREYMGRHDVYGDMLNEEQLNSGMVIWRDVMAERLVRSLSGYVVLGETYEPKLESSHSLPYANNASKAFLAR